MFTVTFPNLGRWCEVVVVDARTAHEAEHTVRGRYRCGPYATITAVPGRSATVRDEIRVERPTRRAMWMAAALVLPLAILIAIVGAVLR